MSKPARTSSGERPVIPIGQIFKRSPPLGGSVAEQEENLPSYYVERDAFLCPILENLPGLFIHVGPKGSGKSAVQRMVEDEAHRCPCKVLTIKPDDIALWSIVKSPQLVGDVYKEIDQRWLNKTLWNYLFVVELLRQDYGDFQSLWSKLSVFFSADKGRIRRLIERGMGAGARASFSARFLELIDEIKLSGKVSGTELSASIKPNAVLPRDNILNDLTTVVGKISSLLSHDFLILLDDLDLNWTSEATHISLLEGLIASMQSLVRTRKVSFVVAMREDIFRALTPDDSDKLRQSLRHFDWMQKELKSVVRSRITWAIGSAQKAQKEEGFPEVFEQGADLHLLWEVCDNPRRVIQAVEAVIESARRDGTSRANEQVLGAMLEEKSREFLGDLDVLHRTSRPGLKFVARSFRQAGKQFDYGGAELFCTDLLERLEGGAESAPPGVEWVRGMVNSPLHLLRELMMTGLVEYKANRSSQPKAFVPETDSLDEKAWFAVAPAYALGLGL